MPVHRRFLAAHLCTAHRCAVFSAALLLTGCWRSPPAPSLVPEVRELSSSAVGDNLGILRTEEWVYLTYPDLGALSLNLLRLSSQDLAPGAPNPKEQGGGSMGQPTGAAALRVAGTTYLDRITETPEIGENFGTASLAFREGLLNVFYSDREREGTPVLKWVSGSPQEDKWWIDILPYPGEPLAVLPSADGDFDLYLLRGGALVRQSLAGGDAQELLSPCDPARDVCTLADRQPVGITLFDRASQRLYAVLPGPEGVGAEPIYTAGATHHAVLHDGRLRVLLFAPEDSTLLLLEEKPASNPRAFAVTPVTLCAGTTSVFLAYRKGRPFFLYDQRVTDQDGSRRSQLTLLSPLRTQAGEISFRPTTLLELDAPLRRFVVSPAGTHLHVFFVQETLKMLSLDLEAFSSE